MSDPTAASDLRALLTETAAFLRNRVIYFSEGKQQFSCAVCRYRDPLGDAGTKLHSDGCVYRDLEKRVDAVLEAAAPVPDAGEQ